MQPRTFVSLMLALMVGASAAASQQASDPISGDWEVSFKVQGTATPATFTLKLDGEKVTGTAYSEHTGPGTLRNGSWARNELAFTVDFARHESIAITGRLKDGKLVGEFRTEGFQSEWEASKKSGPVANARSEAADPISGDWDAIFAAQGTSVPITLKLKLEGGKITGTSESTHLGSGTVSKGSWAANKLSFTLESARMSIAVNGVLKEGKLLGEFDAGQLKGAWEAKRK